MKFVLSLLCLFTVSGAFAANPAKSQQALTLTPTYQSIHDVILVNKCIICHKPGGEGDKVLLDTYDNLMAGRKVVIAGDPERSKLIRQIEKGKMPPSDSDAVAVTEDELAAMRTWIENGANP